MRPAQSGQMGEAAARAGYERDGYRVLACNFRTREGEVDLIVEKGGMLVFAEVKTRSGRMLAAPREWVDRHKQQRIIKAAKAYLARYSENEPIIRFDVVEVLGAEGTQLRVNRIEDAFGVE